MSKNLFLQEERNKIHAHFFGALLDTKSKSTVESVVLRSFTRVNAVVRKEFMESNEPPRGRPEMEKSNCGCSGDERRKLP
jgi:hypothetical protein